MPTSATSQGDVAGGGAAGPEPRGRYPAALLLLFIAQAVVVLAVAAWMTFAVFALSRPLPTGVAIGLILMLAGVPLVIVALANRAASALWHRSHRSIAVAVAVLPLPVSLGALGVAITM